MLDGEDFHTPWAFPAGRTQRFDHAREVEHPFAAIPAPVDRDYWVEQGKRRPGEIVCSHRIKYPYSFYALAKDVRDEELKKRILDKLYHLTAIS